MSELVDQLHAVVEASLTALKAVSKPERDKPLTATSAQQYNDVRGKIATARPDLAQALPPELKFNNVIGNRGFLGNYVDLLMHYQQLSALLSMGDPPLAPIRA